MPQNRLESITVLFLCTGNSARSIMAEAILNKIGNPRFWGHSAGSHPTGSVNPLAIELLTSLNYPTKNLRSKSWTEFSSPKSSPFSMVITVCDRAAAEACPVWPGQPVSGHWSLPDPASATGNSANRLEVFRQVYQELQGYIQQLVQLPSGSLDTRRLQMHLNGIKKKMPTIRRTDHECGR